MTNRRFPPPWTVERLPGGFKVIDANGQSLAYFYARENDHDANTAGVLTMDEARRMASNFAKLPDLLGRDWASVGALSMSQSRVGFSVVGSPPTSSKEAPA